MLNAPKSTFHSDRFIDSHICTVRMKPAAPTSAPPMISEELPMTKPVPAAARPDSELSSDTTTGMSAPPIGSTISMPITSAMTAAAR